MDPMRPFAISFAMSAVMLSGLSSADWRLVQRRDLARSPVNPICAPAIMAASVDRTKGRSGCGFSSKSHASWIRHCGSGMLVRSGLGNRSGRDIGKCVLALELDLELAVDCEWLCVVTMDGSGWSGSVK